MNLRSKGAEIFIPDNCPTDKAIGRTTHLAIAAHQDDVEIMAYDGILKCFGKKDKWFGAVVVTNGAGSPRSNLYADYSDEDMQEVRKLEQKKAAYVGEYGAALMLNYPSSDVKDGNNREVIEELKEIIGKAKPQTIYTHNLADKHDTHVGVTLKVIQALRELPAESHPAEFYGCEVWRSLDWVNDREKVIFDVSGQPNLAAALVEVFDSQVSGGKRYDLATIGRRLANATYAESHGTDQANAYIYGINLKPLIHNPELDINDFVLAYVNRFAEDVANRIRRVM